jgi:hypothetical protein
MTDIPHFALPLRFENGAAVVVDQDTTDDVLSCALAVLLCPLGFRAELSDFGIEDPTFSEGFVDTEAIAEALAEWEPRAQSVVTTRMDAGDNLIQSVLAALDVPSID